MMGHHTGYTPPSQAFLGLLITCGVEGGISVFLKLNVSFTWAGKADLDSWALDTWVIPKALSVRGPLMHKYQSSFNTKA